MNRTEVISEIVQKAMVLSDAKLEGVYDFVNFLSDRNVNKIKQQQDEIQQQNQIHHLVEIQEKVEIQVQVEVQEKKDELQKEAEPKDEVEKQLNLQENNNSEISNNYNDNLTAEKSTIEIDDSNTLNEDSINIENSELELEIEESDIEENKNESINQHKTFDFFQDEEIL